MWGNILKEKQKTFVLTYDNYYHGRHNETIFDKIEKNEKGAAI